MGCGNSSATGARPGAYTGGLLDAANRVPAAAGAAARRGSVAAG